VTELAAYLRLASRSRHALFVVHKLRASHDNNIRDGHIERFLCILTPLPCDRSPLSLQSPSLAAPALLGSYHQQLRRLQCNTTTMQSAHYITSVGQADREQQDTVDIDTSIPQDQDNTMHTCTATIPHTVLYIHADVFNSCARSIACRSVMRREDQWLLARPLCEFKRGQTRMLIVEPSNSGDQKPIIDCSLDGVSQVLCCIESLTKN